MQRPNPAAARFYKAFYSWHIQTTRSWQSSSRCLHPPTCCSLYSTSARSRLDNKGLWRSCQNITSRIQRRHKPTNVVRGRSEGEQLTTKKDVETEDLGEDVKRALRTLTHPVVLITSSDGNAGSFEIDQASFDHFRGVTVSSFNTVTLSPTPIVSFNLRIPSRSWDAIHSSGQMTVHILSATPKGAAMAHAFTQPYDKPGEPFQRLERLGVQASVQSHQHAPSLKWAGAMIAQINATLLKDKCVDVGDHIMVVAEVNDVFLPTIEKPEDNKAVDRYNGLAYAMRGYRDVGRAITPVDLPQPESELNDMSIHVAQEIDEHDSKDSNHTPSNHDRRSREAAASGNEIEVESDIGLDRLVPDDAGLSNSGQTRTISSAKIPQMRSMFSTLSARMQQHSPSGVVADTQQAPEIKDLQSHVSSPHILSSTVGDFLGVSQERTQRLPRIAFLINARAEAEKAARQLQRALADGSLTPEESTRLEKTITRNEQLIAKTIALRSAKDLQRMLDQGKVDFRRAQWMESSIEKGQAVLLEEAKQLRALLDDSTITLEQFRTGKTQLEQENTLLTTEAMRLRQMVDEEAEGGGNAPTDASAGFDGFRGNV